MRHVRPNRPSSSDDSSAPPTVRRSPRPRALLLAVALLAALPGCGPLDAVKNLREVSVFQVEASPPRLNLVIDKWATDALYQVYRTLGLNEARKLMKDRAPDGRGGRKCLGRVCFDYGDPRATFLYDVDHRNDLDDALRDSQSRNECLTWTYLPRSLANWTTRTNQCRR